MNWLGWTAVFFAFPAFALGRWSAKRNSSSTLNVLGWGVGFVLAIPAAFYFAYYAQLFGELIWFYKLRAVAGTELLASPAGFLAGWLQARVVPRLRLSGWEKRLLMPILLGFGVAVPYLKPILKPQPIYALREQWRDGVCLQSTFSTCGPAAAATVLNQLGFNVSERELAVEAFSSVSGTENWYLARALRQRGLRVSFACSKALDAPLPAIVGVRLKQTGNTGHFIALLGKQGNAFIFGDPMEGRFTNTLAEVAGKYEFTGFMLSIQAAQGNDGALPSRALF